MTTPTTSIDQILGAHASHLIAAETRYRKQAEMVFRLRDELDAARKLEGQYHEAYRQARADLVRHAKVEAKL